MAQGTEIDRLTWRKASPETYERSLDAMEKFFALAGEGGVGATDGQHWHISVAAKFNATGINIKQDIVAAWIMLRNINPCLSAVVENDRWVYTVAGKEELRTWLDESLHFYEGDKTARDIFPIRNMTGRAALHVLLNSGELYLLAPHTHLDGIGAYTAMSNLLQCLVDVASAFNEPDNEASRLSPPLDVLASIPPATDADNASFNMMLKNWMAGFAGVKLQVDDPRPPCREPRIIYDPFDEEESRRIIARCKELGFTVTVAVQAAVSLALRKYVKSTATVQSAVTIHDVRKWIDKTEFPANTLVGPMAIPVPAVFTLADNLVSTAELAKTTYRKPDESGMLRILPRFWGTNMVQIMASTPKEVGGPASLGVSSFGIMDKYVRPAYEGSAGRKIDVEDVWLGITLYSPDILLHLWTLQGCMRLQCVYNEAYHEQAAIRELLDNTKRELMQGLELV